MVVYGEYFYGHKISEYGLQNGYVDYSTLAKSFDMVLNNDIMSKTMDIGYWEQVSGFVDNSEEIERLEDEIASLENVLDNIEDTESVQYASTKAELDELEEEKAELEDDDGCAIFNDIYQYFIVSDPGAKILMEINQIVFYNEELDVYVWGVTHFGTSWSYVLTDIKCNVPYESVQECAECAECADDSVLMF